MSEHSAATWRRTSPVAVLFYLLKSARRVVTDGLPGLAALAAVLATARDWVKVLSLAGVGVLVAFGVFWAALSYLRFRFRISGDQILVRRGVLRREQLNVEFDRIQDVAIDQPFYTRPLGLAILNLDTAGSSKKEIALAGIPLELARRIRDEIISKRRDDELKAPDEPSSERFLLARDNGDIARYGLTVNALLWVAIAAGAFLGTVGDDLPNSALGSWMVRTLRLQELNLALEGIGPAVGIALAIGVLILLAVLLSLLSILGALWRYAGYRLTVDGQTYHRSSGLVSRQEQTLKRRKIQAAIWRQNAVGRWLNRINLQLRMVSAGQVSSGGHGMAQHRPAFVVPALHAHEARDLTSEFLPGLDPARLRLSPIHRGRYLRKTLMLNWTPPIAGLTIGASMVSAWLPAVVVIGGYALASACAYLRWQRYGYGTEGSYGCLRQGFVGYKTTLFPLFKTQRVDLRQSPAQRRLGLAHLTVHLASHSVTMPFMPVDDARRFADLALYQAESSDQRWF